MAATGDSMGKMYLQKLSANQHFNKRDVHDLTMKSHVERLQRSKSGFLEGYVLQSNKLSK